MPPTLTPWLSPSPGAGRHPHCSLVLLRFPPFTPTCLLHVDLGGLLLCGPELTQHVLHDENGTGESQGRPTLCPLGLSCLCGQRPEAKEVPSRPGPQSPASALGSPVVQKGPCARGLGEESRQAWKGPGPCLGPGCGQQGR